MDDQGKGLCEVISHQQRFAIDRDLAAEGSKLCICQSAQWHAGVSLVRREFLSICQGVQPAKESFRCNFHIRSSRKGIGGEALDDGYQVLAAMLHFADEDL